MTVTMTSTAFWWWITVAAGCGVVIGLLLARLIWIIATNYGTHPAPRFVFRWERDHA